MQSVQEVVFVLRPLNILYLLQILVHVLRVNIRCVKFIQRVNLFYTNSDLIFLAYIHCFSVIIFLVLVSRLYRKRETRISREKYSLSWLIRSWERSLKNFKNDTAHAPHILRLVILFLQKRNFWSSVPSGTNKVGD